MQTIHYLSVENVLEVHRRVIEEFGGDPGLRDRDIVATVESDLFAGMSDFEQQDRVWAALRGGLTEEELTRVEFVFTRRAYGGKMFA